MVQSHCTVEESHAQPHIHQCVCCFAIIPFHVTHTAVCSSSTQRMLIYTCPLVYEDVERSATALSHISHLLCYTGYNNKDVALYEHPACSYWILPLSTHFAHTVVALHSFISSIHIQTLLVYA